jgi:hypothetical protein
VSAAKTPLLRRAARRAARPAFGGSLRRVKSEPPTRRRRARLFGDHPLRDKEHDPASRKILEREDAGVCHTAVAMMSARVIGSMTATIVAVAVAKGISLIS